MAAKVTDVESGWCIYTGRVPNRSGGEAYHACHIASQEAVVTGVRKCLSQRLRKSYQKCSIQIGEIPTKVRGLSEKCWIFPVKLIL